MVEVSKATGLPVIAVPTNLSKLSKLVTSLKSAPAFCIGNRKRVVSYKSNTDACACALVPPFVNLLKSFPSILIGLPSLCLTITGITSPPFM